MSYEATDGNFHWLSHNDADEEGVFACTNGNTGIQPYPWDEHDQEPDGGAAQNCLILYSSFKWGWANCSASHSSVCKYLLRLPTHSELKILIFHLLSKRWETH
jgi:hypothetical protein